MTDLTGLPIGASARVLEVNLPAPLRARVGVFGLLQGRLVRMVRVAPLGDPIEIEVGATRLSLRRAEAQLVNIAPVGP